MKRGWESILVYKNRMFDDMKIRNSMIGVNVDRGIVEDRLERV